MKKRRRIEKFNSDGSRDIRTGFQTSVTELCIVIDEYKRELKQAHKENERLRAQTLSRAAYMMRMVPQQENIGQ